MPRKPKTTEPEAKPDEAAPETPKGTKTGAIKAALKANPEKQPKEIAELLNAEGWDVKPQRVSVVKSVMKAKRKAKKAAPVATSETAPAVPADAVSIGLLCQAKRLAAQFSSIKEAKAALNALAQLLD